MFINKDVHPDLKGIVRFFWFAYGSLNNESENQMLLPMDHSDMIVGCKGHYYYEMSGQVIVPDQVAFHGIRRKPIQLVQDGYNETFGISFEPWGLYPLIKEDMSLYADKITGLSKVNIEMNSKIRGVISELANDSAEIHSNDEANAKLHDLSSKVEKILMDNLELNEVYLENVEAMRAYYYGDYNSIEAFCNSSHVNRRSLQRHFNKYVGVGPKELVQIRNFEETSRDLIYQEEPVLNDVVYHGSYYDQAHFNKTFKKVFTPYPQGIQ